MLSVAGKGNVYCRTSDTKDQLKLVTIITLDLVCLDQAQLC